MAECLLPKVARRLPIKTVFGVQILVLLFWCILFGSHLYTNKGELKLQNNVVFALRTTRKNHQHRMGILLDTWIAHTNPYQVHVFSEYEDDHYLLAALDRSSVGFQSAAKCSKHYTRDFRTMLCCKTGLEQEFFMSLINQYSDIGWFCHVDDDMYINLQRLYTTLDQFQPLKDNVYFGRRVNHRLKEESTLLPQGHPRRGDRYYLMYGGFYCMSRALVEAASQYLSGAIAMQSTCMKAMENDDTSLGAVVNLLVRDVVVAHSSLIHHHVKTDPLPLIPSHTLSEQIAVSYGFGHRPVFSKTPNVLNIINPLFTLEEDPTRLKSYHCLLYPQDKLCITSI